MECSLRMNAVQKGAIGWTVEYGAECLVYHFPSLEFRAYGTEEMSVNVTGATFNKDTFDMSQFMSGISEGNAKLPQIEYAQLNSVFARQDTLDYLTALQMACNTITTPVPTPEQHSKPTVDVTHYPALTTQNSLRKLKAITGPGVRKGSK
ncbi:Hypothetical protein NTJ_16253 [Nesidiocoris tenuis]|uniref:Uncharacterized protein n=1 Tax=Nesidiocoris tenuis TaxID=355587 RepID=A0ABN7BGD5_9HEMI|nr:Hypothetical protein NTJ_16253 [Nesidiocoris tenuis]